jgi:hypothetical protein
MEYENIRIDTTDISKIAQNTGMPEWKISRIKDHVFSNEHILDAGVKRFDADSEIADAWGLTFILVPTRIIVHHRIILTVRIQIQPVPAVPILLHKPSQHRIVKSRPQKIVMIILAGFY